MSDVRRIGGPMPGRYGPEDRIAELEAELTDATAEAASARGRVRALEKEVSQLRAEIDRLRAPPPNGPALAPRPR
jgi:hypothetical protein